MRGFSEPLLLLQCDSDFSVDFLRFGVGDFPFRISLKTFSKSCFFGFWRRDPGFGAAISHAFARSSIVFCNLISGYRIVMAVSRFLGAAAACVILWSFAAGQCESYWSGCIKAAVVICRQIFLYNFGAGDSPFKIPFKKCFTTVFLFALALRSGFGAAISVVIMNQKVSLCKRSLFKSLLCVKLSVC